MINAIAARTAREEIERRYGAERLQLVRWSRDLVEHQSALTALPVFYLEAHDGAAGGLLVVPEAEVATFKELLIGHYEGTQTRECAAFLKSRC